MKTITVNELHALLRQEPRPLVIDVRTPAEYAEEHIDGALNIPLHDLRSAGLPAKHRRIYLLCHCGVRSNLAADQLAADGFENLVVIKCGMLAWKEARLPVVERPAPQSTEAEPIPAEVRLAWYSRVRR